MYLNLAGHLDMGYKVEISTAFIDHPTDESVLKYGFRAMTWRDDEMYKNVSEADTPEGAFAGMVASLKTPARKPFINQYEDKEVVQTIELDDPEWSLSLYSPNMRMDDPPESITYKTHPKAITGKFQVVKSKAGDCKKLCFEGRNNLLNIGILSLVTLWYADKALFYGPVVQHPHPSNERPGKIEVLGPRHKLETSMLDLNKIIQGRLSVQTFISEISKQASAFKGPVTYNLEKIQAHNRLVEFDQQSLLPVSAILDQLVLKLPNGRWGVDAEGELFLYSLE
jgi:hypothetical protein